MCPLHFNFKFLQMYFLHLQRSLNWFYDFDYLHFDT